MPTGIELAKGARSNCMAPPAVPPCQHGGEEVGDAGGEAAHPVEDGHEDDRLDDRQRDIHKVGWLHGAAQMKKLRMGNDAGKSARGSAWGELINLLQISL